MRNGAQSYPSHEAVTLPRRETLVPSFSRSPYVQVGKYQAKTKAKQPFTVAGAGRARGDLPLVSWRRRGALYMYHRD